MALVINTNITSLNAQRQLGKSSMMMETAMERLSSGSRINSAADDAAGLAISNRQTSQIRGLDQAVRNANDGISLIQTAEGALQESTNILQRMRELAIQSANGIYSDTDRATLDAEVQQLVSELDRIATSTSFNGQNILDGTLSEVDLQVGSEANQTISFEVEAVDADTLGMGSLSADVVGGEIVSTLTGLSENDILINGQAIGAFSSTESLETLVGNINENVNGVTASTVVEMVASSIGTGIVGTSTASTITVTKNDGTSFVVNVLDTDTLEEYASKVVENSGGLVSASVNDDGYLTVSAQDAQQLTIGGGASVIGVVSTDNVTAKIVLESDNGEDITIERGATGTMTDLNNYGFRETATAGVIVGAGLVQTDNGANEALSVGELTINGVEIDNDDTGSLIKKIDAINEVSDQTGVTANAYAQAVIDMSTYTASAASDTIVINGITVDLAITSGDSDESIVTTLNTFTDETGVSARLSGSRIVLESDQGAIELDTQVANAFLVDVTKVTITTASATGTFAEATTTLTSSATFSVEAGLKLTSQNGNPISIELGDGTDFARLGLIDANNLGSSSFGTSVSSISVDTASNAQSAVTVIDNALESVNDLRSQLGAVSNRLDFTISNLSNVSENASAARSRIMDADFAAETAALSKAQVLQQASQAMLAQANARPQQVLSLLQ